MNYKQIYDSLIQKRTISPLIKFCDGYENGSIETHHIIPKCIGGSNNKDNLINLYTREHFFAHLLLRKIYPSNKKLSCAIIKMTGHHQRRITSRLYQNIRKELGLETQLRLSKYITYNGQTHTYKEWSKITGISRKAISDRLNNGWTVKEALTTPQRQLIEINDNKLYEIAKNYNIKYKTLVYRIKVLKMNLDDALTIKKSELLGKKIDMIKNNNIIQTFNSLDDAYIFMKNNFDVKSKTSIQNCCSGRSKTSCGFIFKYHDSL